MSFLWELNFIPKMRKTIQEKSYLFQEPQMMELTDYIQLYPWKFDLQALQEFFQLREGAGEAEF
jgi:thermostable 8-oxoguanine DNA glycosylase